MNRTMKPYPPSCRDKIRSVLTYRSRTNGHHPVVPIFPNVKGLL